MGTYFFESKYPGSDPDGFRNAVLRLAKKFNLPMIMNTYDRRLKKTMINMDQNKIIRPDLFIGLYDFGSINKYLSYKGSFIRRKIVASFIKMRYGLKLPFENKFSVKEDMKQRIEIYKSIISNEVKPGINHLLIHPAAEKGYDGTSLTELENKKNGLDRIIRLSDREIWSSDEMKKFLRKEKIKVINYKMLMEIQKKGI